MYWILCEVVVFKQLYAKFITTYTEKMYAASFIFLCIKSYVPSSLNFIIYSNWVSSNKPFYLLLASLHARVEGSFIMTSFYARLIQFKCIYLRGFEKWIKHQKNECNLIIYLMEAKYLCTQHFLWRLLRDRVILLSLPRLLL